MADRIEDGGPAEAGRDLVDRLLAHVADIERHGFVNAERADLEEAAAEITRLRAENAQMKMPDMFWLWQDPEYACEGWQEALEEFGELAGVVRFQTALQLPDKWGAHRVRTVDENGDPDETEEALFDTEAEARACWPDSLEAARARQIGLSVGSADHG